MSANSKEYMREWRAKNKDKVREYLRQWREANPDYMREYGRQYRADPANQRRRKSNSLRFHYGITIEDFEALMEDQGNCCAICSRVIVAEGRDMNSAHVDHDHETGEVRQILCAGCNKGLGYFEENPDALVAAAAYLMRWQASKERNV